MAGYVKNKGVITQPNFLLSADILKTTKATSKILNLRTFFPAKQFSGVFLHNVSWHQKSGWLTLYFYHGLITGRVFPEYIAQTCMTSDQNQTHFHCFCWHFASLFIALHINHRKWFDNRLMLYLPNRVLWSLMEFWHSVNKKNITAHKTPGDIPKSVHVHTLKVFLVKGNIFKKLSHYVQNCDLIYTWLDNLVDSFLEEQEINLELNMWLSLQDMGL